MPKGVYTRTPEMKTGEYSRTSDMRTGKHLRTNSEIENLKSYGQKGAMSRWKGHVKLSKEESNKRPETLSKKRFRNQRYKARKRNAPGSHTYGEWELLKIQYGYTCPCCEKSEPYIKLTEDHIIPLSRGGSDCIENIQPLCMKCNRDKWTSVQKFEPKNNQKESEHG